MSGDFVGITACDGHSFQGYFCQGQANKPALVLLHEIFGITDWVKSITDDFAANGYWVCAPDMYGRVDPGFIGNREEPEMYQRSRNYRDTMDRQAAMQDIEATAEFLKGQPGCNGKWAVTGFCMGGTLTYLAAARLQPDATIAYYGTQIHDFLDEGRHVDCQTIFHMGEHDHLVGPENDHRIHAALIGKFNIAIYKYDAGHAFANSTQPDRYSAEAAELAHQRTFALLNKLQ